MKNNGVSNRIARRRRNITIAFAALSVIVCGIFYAMMRQRVPNMHVLFYLVLGILLLLLIHMVLWTLSSYEKYSKLFMVLRRCYMICITIGLTCFIILQGFIISGARSDDATVDCLVILGAGLRNDVPSLMLRKRMNAAVEYLKTQGDIPVIVSGGQGPGETITEAEAMFRYLKTRGVDENLIWKEESSTNTQENLAFSRALMEEKGLDVDKIWIAVVSNEFHLYRAKLIAGKVGLDAIGIAAETPGIYQRAIYFCREAFALASEVLS